MNHFAINSWSGIFGRPINQNNSISINKTSIFNFGCGCNCIMPRYGGYKNFFGFNNFNSFGFNQFGGFGFGSFGNCGMINALSIPISGFGMLLGGILGSLILNKPKGLGSTEENGKQEKIVEQTKNKPKSEIEEKTITPSQQKPEGKKPDGIPNNECPDENIKNEINNITTEALKLYIKQGKLNPKDIGIPNLKATIKKCQIVRAKNGTMLTVCYTFKGKNYYCQKKTNKLPQNIS